MSSPAGAATGGRMRPEVPPARFSAHRGGRLVCRVCADEGGQHYPTCALVALDTELRALAAHVGMCVAGVKESLETIGRLIRDEGGPLDPPEAS
jgi:hypothetical protein